ncbi:MAG: flippase-like domain-containing protein [Candidatus Schekmanbacteria bacterium]|nr:flippase-like domain-containing protein [Candidatus Schekmanbacteria bacterium]
MKKKSFLIGFIISAFFIYLAVNKVDYGALKESLVNCNYLYLIPMVALSVLLQLCKAYRWKLIITPVKKIRLSLIYYLHCIGFMGINILPFRLGEFLRPYLLSKQGDVKLSTSVATTVMERILDGGTLLLFMIAAVRFAPVPDWVLKAGESVFAVIALSIMFLFFLVWKGRRYLLKFTSFKPLAPFQEKTIRIFDSFKQGFDIMPDKKAFIFAIILSVIFWVIPVFNTYLLFSAFSMALPFSAALTLFIIVSIGLMIPSAPGFIGNFQFFCILALSLYGVNKSEALGFSIVLNAVQFFSIIAQGILSLFLSGIRFNEVMKAGESLKTENIQP